MNANEKQFLVQPIGDIDDDPRDIIAFVGITAIPVKKTGPRRRRGDVTIAFFELNNREELRRERAELLDSLGNHLETIEDTTASAARKALAKNTVRRMLRPSSGHTSCVKSMVDLFIADRNQARKLIDAARAFLDSLP